MNGLGIGDVAFRVLDVLIFTEVRDEVVSLGWVGGRTIVDMIELGLSCGNIYLGSLDVFIFAKMWDEVVSLWWIRR